MRWSRRAGARSSTAAIWASEFYGSSLVSNFAVLVQQRLLRKAIVSFVGEGIPTSGPEPGGAARPRARRVRAGEPDHADDPPAAAGGGDGHCRSIPTRSLAGSSVGEEAVARGSYLASRRSLRQRRARGPAPRLPAGRRAGPCLGRGSGGQRAGLPALRRERLRAAGREARRHPVGGADRHHRVPAPPRGSRAHPGRGGERGLRGSLRLSSGRVLRAGSRRPALRMPTITTGSRCTATPRATRRPYAAFVDEWVLSVGSHEGYLAKLGRRAPRAAPCHRPAGSWRAGDPGGSGSGWMR